MNRYSIKSSPFDFGQYLAKSADDALALCRDLGAYQLQAAGVLPLQGFNRPDPLDTTGFTVKVQS
jgi:hypothetical protein